MNRICLSRPEIMKSKGLVEKEEGINGKDIAD